MNAYRNPLTRVVALAQLALGALLLTPSAEAANYTLLNAAYDVARDVYKDLNPLFVADWQKAHPGDTVKVDQSHGGSSKQARAVIDGLQADIAAMNSPLDIDAIAKAGLTPADWAQRLPHASSPSWSTILFLVRKGNPKQIKDWNDLVRPDVKVVIPNPKTSGNARYSYLAAWEYARRQPGGNDATARAFVARFLANVPVFDTGGRGATTTFVQRGIGDVLLTFENEVQLIASEFAAEQGFQIVVPPLSVRTDNPIAVVDKIADRKKTRPVAEAYAKFHFSPAGQEVFAKYGLRPSDPAILARHRERFPALELFTVEDRFGGWEATHKTHFTDGGVFDQIMQAKN
ncbi:MAG TPA: sulfate ABC transporter substrate-binding protein [Solimonas sp.]